MEYIKNLTNSLYNMANLRFKPRRVIQHQNSLFCSLPIDWCRSNNIKRRSLLDMTINENGNLTVTPLEDKNAATQ